MKAIHNLTSTDILTFELCLTKVQFNLKAIHNIRIGDIDLERLCLTKVQFNLKAIHNDSDYNSLFDAVVSDQGTIQFESDSQRLKLAQHQPVSCV